MEKLASQSWQGDHGNGVNQFEAVRRTKTQRGARRVIIANKDRWRLISPLVGIKFRIRAPFLRCR